MFEGVRMEKKRLWWIDIEVELVIVIEILGEIMEGGEYI